MLRQVPFRRFVRPTDGLGGIVHPTTRCRSQSVSENSYPSGVGTFFTRDGDASDRWIAEVLARLGPPRQIPQKPTRLRRGKPTNIAGKANKPHRLHTAALAV